MEKGSPDSRPRAGVMATEGRYAEFALGELRATARRLIAADPEGVSPRYRLVTALMRRTGT
jgi:hypothetical protein